MLLNPPQLKAYSESLLAVVLFLSNLLFAANSGYFSPALEEAPLLHTWSLAVEEQFYLLFPLLLLWLHRRAPGHLFEVVLALALASFALSVWGSYGMAQSNFFSPASRAWELLAGALAALWRRKHGARSHGGAAFLGLAAMVASFVLHSDATPYPGVATLLPVLGTVTVILYAGQTTATGKLLSSQPFVAVGLLSYSAYLWHQPLFALARATAQQPPGWGVMAALALASLVLAGATWALVEQPFRRPVRRVLPQATPLIVAAGLGTALCVAAAAVGIATAGNDASWRARHPDKAARLDMVLAARLGNGLPADDGACRFNLTTLTQVERSRIAVCAAQHGPAMVVLGDSHAIDLFAALTALSPAPFLLGITNGGCRPGDADAACVYDAFADLIATQPRQFGQIVFVQSGAYLLLGPDGRAGNRQLFSRASQAQAMAGLRVNTRAVADLAEYLAQLARTVPVTWIAARIEPHVSPNRVMAQDCTQPVSLRPGQSAIFEQLDAVAQAAALSRAVTYLPLALQSYDPKTDLMSCTSLYWSDGDHWSPSGEQRFGTRLLPDLPAGFR